AARPAGGRACERCRCPAPAGGGGSARRVPRSRADLRHTRPGALRPAARGHARMGLPGRAARLTRCFDELPGLIEEKLGEHERVALIYFDAFGWRFLERHA